MKLIIFLLTFIFFAVIVIEDREEPIKPFNAEEFKHFKEKKSENSKYFKALFYHGVSHE